MVHTPETGTNSDEGVSVSGIHAAFEAMWLPGRIYNILHCRRARFRMTAVHTTLGNVEVTTVFFRFNVLTVVSVLLPRRVLRIGADALCGCKFLVETALPAASPNQHTTATPPLCLRLSSSRDKAADTRLTSFAYPFVSSTVVSGTAEQSRAASALPVIQSRSADPSSFVLAESLSGSQEQLYQPKVLRVRCTDLQLQVRHATDKTRNGKGRIGNVDAQGTAGPLRVE